MKRLVAAIFFAAGLTVVAPPAEASVSLTIEVSETTIMRGDSVVISGKAARARIGTTIRLQHKRPNGWRTVTSKTIGMSRTYSFRVTPPKGRQTYRALKPRQYGQPRVVSPSVTIKVQWVPTLTLDAVIPVHDVAGMQFQDVSGRTNAFGTEVALQHETKYGGWTSWGRATVGPTGAFKARLRNLAQGTLVRAVIHGTGPRLRATSAIQVTGLQPFDLTLDGSAVNVGGVGGSETGAPGAIAHFTAQYGDLVSFNWGYPYYGPALKVMGPDGQEVPARRPGGPTIEGTEYFFIPSDGAYTLLMFSAFENTSWTVRAFRQAEHQTTIDAAAQGVYSSTAGRLATLEFAGEAGQVVNVALQEEPADDFCGRMELLREGEAVPAVGKDYHFTRTFNLESDGTYSLLFIPCANDFVWFPVVRVAAMARSVAIVNESPATTVIDEPGDAAIFSFDASAGQELNLYGERDGSPAGLGRMTAPDGTVITPSGSQFVAEQTGTYEIWLIPFDFVPAPMSVKLWVSTPLEIDSALDAEPIALGPIPRRRLDFHFSGTADQYVTLLEDFPTTPRCATIFRIYDEDGILVEPEDLMTVVRLPHDGTYEARVYPCATSGSIGLVSSVAAEIGPGESATVPLVNPSGVVLVHIPPSVPGVDVTVSDIQIGDDAAYWAQLWAPNGLTAQRLTTSSLEPFTLSTLYSDGGLNLILRSEDPYATGSVHVSVAAWTLA